jgi:hypothetical protein
VSDESKLTELILALESADGPSRELDAEIAAALFGGKAAHQFSRDTPGGRLRSSYSAGVVFLSSDENENRGHVLCRHHRTSPLVTSDLNAAYDLAKRLAPGVLISTSQGPDNSYAWVAMGLVSESCNRPDQHLALAICAAALRAKCAEGGR